MLVERGGGRLVRRVCFKFQLRRSISCFVFDSLLYYSIASQANEYVLCKLLLFTRLLAKYSRYSKDKLPPAINWIQNTTSCYSIDVGTDSMAFVQPRLQYPAVRRSYSLPLVTFYYEVMTNLMFKTRSICLLISSSLLNAIFCKYPK